MGLNCGSWVSSARAGVLCRTKETWSVFWFDPPKSHLQGRSLLFGGGSWSADLRHADEVEPVPLDRLRAMGMDRSLKRE